MLSRALGRLITGPVAFLASGIIDISAYWFGALTRRYNGWPRRKRGRPRNRGSTITPR